MLNRNYGQGVNEKVLVKISTYKVMRQEELVNTLLEVKAGGSLSEVLIISPNEKASRKVSNEIKMCLKDHNGEPDLTSVKKICEKVYSEVNLYNDFH